MNLRGRRARIRAIAVGVAGLLTAGVVVTARVASAAPVRYEAESATIFHGAVESNHAGFSGTGFVNFANEVGSYVQFGVTAATAGTATVALRYSNGTTLNRPLDITVDGSLVADELSFAGTGAWSTWATRTITVPVTAGSHTVRAIATTVNGGPNLDFLDLEVAPLVTDFQAEAATISQGVVASTHAGFTGTGFVDYNAVAGSYVQFSVPAAVAGAVGLQFRFANGSTANRPMDITVNGSLVANDLAFNPTGAWTTWQTQTTNATLTAGTNTIRATAVTANGGPNLDRLRIGAPTGGTTPVAINGQLHVCGLRLCNQHGNPIQLRGMSTHGIQWYPQCVNNTSLDALASDWKADVLRISMYIQEGGYETNPRLFTDRVHSFIEMATTRGMYAIVDWHMLTPGDPNFNLTRARTFFTEIAQRHRDKVNILYEVANEPNGDSVTWARIKTYHEQIIPVIRAEDPDSVILLGTRAWSSLGFSAGSSETEIVNDPVNATNVMYTFHFYAASHNYVSGLSRAADRIPVFVTEFGTQEASGDGANNFTRSQQFLDVMAQKKVSWVNWNYSDDFRSGAVFTTGTCPGGPFAGTSRLKPAGNWVRDRIRTADDFPTG
jgi:endoglucanase